MITNDQVKEFFFLACAHGWASPKPMNKHSKNAGYRGIEFCHGEFRFLDWYCTTPISTFSMGSITIWYQNTVVWGMQFQGHYPKEVIPFVKAALNVAYLHKWFLGGRGPELFENEKYTYVNTITMNGFARFSGEERIYDRANRTCLGYHSYAGISFLPQS